MNLESKEERIRKRAYALWEEDGSMEGCDDEYWRKAREVVEEEMLQEQNEGASQARPFARLFGHRLYARVKASTRLQIVVE